MNTDATCIHWLYRLRQRLVRVGWCGADTVPEGGPMSAKLVEVGGSW